MSRSSLVTLALAMAVGATVCLAAQRLTGEPLSVENLAPAQTETSPTTPKDIQEIADAMARFKAGDTVGALELLKQAVQKHPDLPPAHLLMAQLYAGTKNGPAMQAALEAAIKETPDDPEAYLMMGQSALQSNRLTEASMMFKQAESLLPRFRGTDKRKDGLSLATHALLAQVAGMKEDYAEVKKHTEAMLAIKPDHVGAMQVLARAMFMQGQVDEALAKLREAAKLNADVLTPEAILAQMYELKGDRENAKKSMIAALKANGKDIKTRLAAAQWALEIGEFGEAMKQAKAALKLDPDSLDAKVFCGNIALFQRDYPTAVQFLEEAHLQSPANLGIVNNLALALVETGEEASKTKAYEYANMNWRLYPKDTEVLSTLGWVLYQIGQTDQAEQALSRAVATGSISPDTRFYIARLYADRERTEDAIKLLEQVVQSKGLALKREDAKALLQQLKQ